MIRIDKEKDIINIEGSTGVIMPEFSTLVKTLYEEGIDKKQLQLYFKMAFMNENELLNFAKKLIQNFDNTEKIKLIVEKVLKED